MDSLSRHENNRGSRGSSLLEITTLIVILGLLAAVAFPIVDRIRENYRNRQFIDRVESISEAASQYYVEHGYYPEVRHDGRPPEDMAASLESFDWEAPTPFGGKWEWVKDRHGVVCAIAVLDPDITEDHLQRFDVGEDDGDLNNGKFRFISDIRYAYVILEDKKSESVETGNEPVAGEEKNDLP